MPKVPAFAAVEYVIWRGPAMAEEGRDYAGTASHSGSDTGDNPIR